MKLDTDHALVVFSGGQDSTTCLGYALQQYKRVTCLSFNYGQSHQVELFAAQRVIQHFRETMEPFNPLWHETVDLGRLIFAGTSPLLRGGDTLETYSSHSEMEAVIGDRVEKTFVPMRNAVFLQLAANRAVCRGASTIITGVCEADNANYPDCREAFIEATEAAINAALGFEKPAADVDEFDRADYPWLRIETPLMHLTKAQSIALALTLPNTYTALAYSHTAYDGAYPPLGGDHASVLRAHGFEQAGVPDPLILRAVGECLMDYPPTRNYDMMRIARDAGRAALGERGEPSRTEQTPIEGDPIF